MLHIISVSPYNSSAWTQCQTLLQPNDVVLFINDGVYILHQLTQPHPCNLYVLEQDATERGLSVPLDIQTVDYLGMVALTERTVPIMTWSF